MILKNRSLVFFLIFIIISIPSIVFTPPFQVPDAITHYQRAYEVSEGELLGTNLSGVSGGYFTSNFYNFTTSFEYLQGPWSAFNLPKASLNTVNTTSLISNGKKIDSGSKTFFPVLGVNSYPPLLYLPIAIILWLCRLLHLNLMFTYYMSELFNLIVFAIIAKGAIARLENFSTGLTQFVMFILFSPMVISLAGSVNPNGLIIALTTLLLSLCVDTNPNQKEQAL